MERIGKQTRKKEIGKDRGAWHTAVHGVVKSQTQPND